MSRASVKTPFKLSIDDLKVIVEEATKFYTDRVLSPYMIAAIRKGLNYNECRGFNLAVYKVTQDIYHNGTDTKLHAVLSNTPDFWVSAKRFLGWIITGKDFDGAREGHRWSAYTDVLPAPTFHTELAQAFLKISEGNNFELSFVDAALFSAQPEAACGNLMPILTWIKPELAPKSGPYKSAVVKTAAEAAPETATEAAPETATEAAPAPIAAAAGAGGASWADMVEKPTQVKAKKDVDELQVLAAMALLRSVVGRDHVLSYDQLEGYAIKLVDLVPTVIKS